MNVEPDSNKFRAPHHSEKELETLIKDYMWKSMMTSMNELDSNKKANILSILGHIKLELTLIENLIQA